MAPAKPQPHSSPHASPAPDAGAADADADADAGFAVFRILLPPSFSDADTSRLYAAVNPLCRRTTAMQFRVEPLDPASVGGRVVAAVIGPAAPVRRVEASPSSAVPLALSPAQEALVAVLDTPGALYCAGEEEEPRGKAPPGRVSCSFLVDADRLQASTGRGVLQKIGLEVGANVRVSTWEEVALAPPPRGQPPEEVVEITGEITAVRKALVAVSTCLQGGLLISNSATYVKEGGTLCSEASIEFGSVNKTHFPQVNTRAIQSKTLQQVSFRLLLPIYLVGGLIGKKRLIIKGIEDETGACIDIAAPVIGCTERVITICALEKPDSEFHIVQSALIHIFDKMMEVERNAHSTFEMAPQFSARALVLKNQVDYLGGSIIKEMVNATGARIQILDDTDVPTCAFKFEIVLQITGLRAALRKGVIALSSCLQGHLPVSDSTVEEEGSILPLASPKVPAHTLERTPSPPAKRRCWRGRSMPPAGSPRLAADHKRGSSSPPSRDRIGKFRTPVGVFWDLENCKVPSGATVEEIAENIRNALSVDILADSTAPIQAYGRASKSIIEALKASGVKHTDIINRKKDAADKFIWVDLLRFALDNPAPACVLLISGDADFAPALHVLVERGYTIIVALPDERTAASDLLDAGTFLWDWGSLARGQGIVSRRQVPVDIEKLKTEMITLYTANGGFIEMGKIQAEYTKMFGKQIKLSDYKVQKMVDLFKLMKDTFSVISRKMVILDIQSAQSNMVASPKASGPLMEDISDSASEEEDDTPEGDAWFEALLARESCTEDLDTPLRHASVVTPGIGHWDATHGCAGDAIPAVPKNRWDESPNPGRIADVDATTAAGVATLGATSSGRVTPTPGKKHRSRWDELPANMGSATPGGSATT